MDQRDIERELERLHPASFGWALACCQRDREEAREVLQAAYVAAIAGRTRFNGHSSVQTWFFGIVRNTASGRRRRRAVRQLALGRWLRSREGEAGSAETPEAASTSAETQRRLWNALAQLSSRQREVLHLVFYQDLTIEGAAEALHLSVGSARTHYERGKARLRGLLVSLDQGAGDRR